MKGAVERTVLVPAEATGAMDRAVAILRQGGLVAFPTDTVYGVGALAWNTVGVLQLYEAKRRSADKAIPLLLAAVEDLSLVARDLPVGTADLAARFWPGPLTLVVPRHPRVPAAVTAGGDTVAVRVPDHPLTRRLIRLLGAPVAATSANLSGQPSPLTAQDVLAQLAGRIDLILDGGPCPGGVASTVVDLTGDDLVVLRAGPVTEKQLREALAGG